MSVGYLRRSRALVTNGQWRTATTYAKVRLLLSTEGVGTNAADNSGRMSLLIATEKKHEAVAHLL